ncbi:MAG: RNA polymerase sigma factor [Candidatus Cryptobacteroides sp.]
MNHHITDKARCCRDEIIVRAFRLLYEPLCGYIRKRIGDIADVEDMAQDVFESLLSADKVITQANVTKYAYACARNRVMDYFRRHACSDRASEYFAALAGGFAQDASDAARLHEIEAAEGRALGSAGEKGRMVYVMNVRAGIPVGEIARRMGIGQRTAENHLMRVRSRVREEVRKVM